MPTNARSIISVVGLAIADIEQAVLAEAGLYFAYFRYVQRVVGTLATDNG